VSLYAEMKTENLHFRYETSLRSAAEQRPGARQILGLVTYTRGVIEQGWYGGVKPIIEGVQTKSGNKVWQGVQSLIGLAAGMSAAKWLITTIAGRVAYGLLQTPFGYTPLSPGLSKLASLAWRVSQVLRGADDDDKTPDDTADALIKAFSDEAEMFIPMVSFYINYYESRNDVSGVKLWTLVRGKLIQQKKAKPASFRRFDRSGVEAWQHIIFGGAERQAKKPPAGGGRAPTSGGRRPTRGGREPTSGGRRPK